MLTSTCTFRIFKLLHIFLVVAHNNAQNWWNFNSQPNPFKLPVFTPLPNQRFTHIPEVNQYGPMPNDVIVDIPKAGMGKFIGFSTTINYDYTWSQWPPIKGRLVNVFLGIPYAAPPVEGQRFRMPVPAFLDTRFPWFAKRFRSACMQPPIWINRFMPGFKDINEDCLYLNIYYPNRTWEDPNTRYPVIVHIHGGSYVYGSSHMYPGLALASKGVVVVTFNYRLGPFGFLSTGDYASIGNYGLWDQLLAITWVKENIAWFHGDPEKITIMGESAGAASVGLHLISPLTRERYLFNQAIMMSGSDLSDWAFSDPMKVRTRYYAIELGRRLGCPSVQSKEVIQLQEAMYNGYLRYIYKDQYAFKQAFDESYVKQYLNIPYAEQTDAYAVVSCLRYDKKAEEINNIVRDIIPLRGAPTFVWTPVVDGTSGFFPRTPSKERTLGNFAKLPLLAGVVQDEGSLTFQFYLSRTENGNYVIGNLTDDVVKRIIGMWLIKMNVLRYNQTAEELYNRYTYWQNLDNNTARWKRAVDLMSDLLISSPLDAVVKYHANHSPPVYFYEFAYSSRNDKEATPETGIYHGIELPFLFGFPFMNKSIWSELFGEGSVLPKCASEVYDYPHDTNMSEFLLDLWTNFVKYGNPTPEKVKNINWSRFRQPEEAYLRIQLNSSIKYHYRSSDMAFWQNRFESLAEPLPASPPIYRSPLIDIRLATVILSCLLAIALISIIIIIILLIRRPNPKHFKSNIRYTTPGSEFHASFKDSFANSNIYSSITPTPITATTTPTSSSVYPHHHQQQQQRPPSTFSYFTNKENKLQTASSLARTNDPLASLLTVNKHPPPPPIPSPQQQQYYDRRSSSSESSNGSLSLISSSSPPPPPQPPSTSRRRQMKQKHDENKPVMKGVNECLVMNRLNQQDPQPYDPLLHTNDNNNNNNPYKPYITDV